MPTDTQTFIDEYEAENGELPALVREHLLDRVPDDMPDELKGEALETARSLFALGE